MIDGFPIDCGTKTRKFLSMAKAQAVTASRRPHRKTETEDAIYVEPFKLHEDVTNYAYQATSFEFVDVLLLWVIFCTASKTFSYL